MARLITKIQKGNDNDILDYLPFEVTEGKVIVVLEVSEQDLEFYPQYYGLPTERGLRQ